MKPLFTLTLIALAGTACAQDAPRPGPARGMMRADANGDGVITRAEFDADNATRFARIDANHDGKLDASELPQRRLRANGPPEGDTPPPPPAHP